MEDQTSEIKFENSSKKGNLFKSFLYIFFLALGIAIGILVTQQKPEWFGLSKGTVATQAETDALVSRIGKLIALPTDEKPTVATVTDASKVKDQPFFKNAKNEDKVLIYQKSARAILYRPSENRIIEVGAVNINNQPIQKPSPEPSP